MLSSDCESDPVSDTTGSTSPEVGQHGRSEQRAAGHRPATIALNRVDLAVVRKVAVGVRQPPLRQRIGGKTLVKHHCRGFHARILEIRIELRQELRHDHPLVDDGARRQRGDVEHGIGAFQNLFGPASRHVQLAVQRLLVDVGARVHEHLDDGGQRLERFQSAGGGVGGQRAKTRDVELLALQLLGEHALRVLGLGGIAVEEYQAGAEPRAQREAGRKSRPRAGIASAS